MTHPERPTIVANGLVTSIWPTCGVADLGNGVVVASAGTHAEFDGGIRVVALTADGGSLVWEKTLSKKPTVIPPGGKGVGGRHGIPRAEFSLINAPSAVENGQIIIDGGTHLNRFSFTPADSEQQLDSRLANQPRR